MLRSLSTLLAASLIVSLFAACGLKGPLYLRNKTAPATIVPSSNTQSTSSSAGTTSEKDKPDQDKAAPQQTGSGISPDTASSNTNNNSAGK